MKATIDEQINKLEQYAKQHGLKIRFRNRKTDQGDFCIFIYDQVNFRKSYAVGFDGCWDSKYVPFDKCLKSAYNWIDRRDKRFTFRDGRWQYGRYHFIIWKDGDGSDREHYLTMEDADKAAAEYMKQGYCVVCYEVEPNETSRLAKVYGDYTRHCNDYVKKQIRKFSNS